MSYNSKIHHRRSIRLQGYDYSRPGAYFVTICVQDRACLFGDVVNGEMRLNVAGVMVSHWYNELMRKFNDVVCDAWVCMPNHVHFIVVNTGNVRLDNAGTRGMGEHAGSLGMGEHIGSPLRRVVQWFKTMSINEYIRGVKQYGWQPFSGRLWQRNYWEHIVRDESELNRIREYIATNPVRWEMDVLHPGHGLRETTAVYGTDDPADDADWMVRIMDDASWGGGNGYAVVGADLCVCPLFIGRAARADT